MEFDNFDAFMKVMLDAFPRAQVGEDNERQLVIYTGLTESPDGRIRIILFPEN